MNDSFDYSMDSMDSTESESDEYFDEASYDFSDEIHPPPELSHILPVINIAAERSKSSYVITIDDENINRAQKPFTFGKVFSDYKLENFANSESEPEDLDMEDMLEPDMTDVTNMTNLNAETSECGVIDKTCPQTGWSDDINKRKIFVGNVPFDCTQEEFETFFADVSGVHKADIVNGHRGDSRGIGFVTMKSVEDAEKLKTRDDIKCKGRILRFYPYKNNVAKNAIGDMSNYVYVDGIPENKNRQWLKMIFNDYGPFNRYFMAINHDTGHIKNTAFLDLVDDYKYDKLLSSKYYAIVTCSDGSKAIPISDSKGRPRRTKKDSLYKIPDNAPILTISRYRQKTFVKNKPRKNARKEQLLSAMIIEEHKGHARERSGKRFRR